MFFLEWLHFIYTIIVPTKLYVLTSLCTFSFHSTFLYFPSSLPNSLSFSSWLLKWTLQSRQQTQSCAINKWVSGSSFTSGIVQKIPSSSRRMSRRRRGQVFFYSGYTCIQIFEDHHIPPVFFLFLNYRRRSFWSFHPLDKKGFIPRLREPRGAGRYGPLFPLNNTRNSPYWICIWRDARPGWLHHAEAVFCMEDFQTVC